MSWGLVAVAGATIVGGVIGSQAAGSAADEQSASAQAGMESEERMFERSLELQQPYREAGYGALEQLQGLATPEGRAQSLQDYYAGPEYAALAAQQEKQALGNAAVTGGVRGGNTQAALASIAPQLGQNYLSNLYNQQTGLANLGMGAASQGAAGATGLGGSLSALQQQAGQASAANSLAQGNIWSGAVGTLGGLAGDYFNRPQTG